jgi:ribose 5-phosphate isomerase A
MNDLKKKAGVEAVKYVKDGDIVGLGTGTTVYFSILELARLVKEGLDIIGIPTSIETEKLAKSQGINIQNIDEYPEIDVSIDGADEVDKNLNLIKGGGGALLKEKIVASASEKRIIVVHEEKYVEMLGRSFALPVEVIKFGAIKTMINLEKLGCSAKIRKMKNEKFLTDNGNYIIDCKFEKIENPSSLSQNINMIPGVVENGLFVNMVEKLVIGRKNSVETIDSE